MKVPAYHSTNKSDPDVHHDWRTPRLVCVASDFTKYDVHAVTQIGRSIELVRYSDFGGELLALELIASTKVDAGTSQDAPPPSVGGRPRRPSRSTWHRPHRASPTCTGSWRPTSRPSVTT